MRILIGTIVLSVLCSTASAARVIGISPPIYTKPPKYVHRETRVYVSPYEYERLRATIGGQRPSVKFGGPSNRSYRNWYRKPRPTTINTPPQWKYGPAPPREYKRWEYIRHD